MKNKNYFDNVKRRLLNQYELKKNILNYIFSNKELNTKYKYNSSIELSKLPKNSFKTRIKNRCIETGRSHGINRKYKYSRLTLREKILNGEIIGMTRSTW